MHLVGPWLTTTSYKKRKSKGITQRDRDAQKEHNKFLKSAKLDTMTLSEYIDYVHGKIKVKTRSVVSTPWHHTESTFRRETPNIPSASSHRCFGTAPRKEPMQYTGKRRLIGIATMHKSNMVPIFADDEEDKSGRKAATEIATMRRN